MSKTTTKTADSTKATTVPAVTNQAANQQASNEQAQQQRAERQSQTQGAAANVDAKDKEKETDAIENANRILGENPESKTAVDKTAAESLLTGTTDEGNSLTSEITAANNARQTDVPDEVVEQAQAVFDADELRQSEQINNANVVNDAKTLIQRRNEAGILSEAQKSAAARVAEIETETSSVENPKKFDKDADKVSSLESVNEKVEKLLKEPFAGKSAQHIHVGTVEREPNMKERFIVSRFPDGRVSHQLFAHEDNAPVQTAKATL